MGLKRFAAATAIALVALHGAAGAETLRLSHNTGDTSTWHKGAEKFNDLVEEKTGDVWSLSDRARVLNGMTALTALDAGDGHTLFFHKSSKCLWQNLFASHQITSTNLATWCPAPAV